MQLPPRFILASTSPRRIELLRLLGMRINLASPNVDETPLPRERPQGLVRRLARAKAESVADGINGKFIVIAADTIVVSSKGRILGKPKDELDARKMLRGISGQTHTVLTGYCLRSESRSHVRVCRTRVKMRSLSASQIAKYVATGEPMDKAGSYAAQGIGMSLVESVTGSYANVVGLPVAQLLLDLEEKFGIPSFFWIKS